MARYYRKQGFVVGCGDEATFGLLPIIKRGWARRGNHPIVIINSKNKCTNVFGARSKTAFVFSFAIRKNQKSFVKFLNKLIKRWNRVCLFVDNGPCHHGKLVDAFMREHRKTFRMFYFPVYSPELNPIEQCWKPARMKLSNRILPSMSTAKYYLVKTFNNEKILPKMFKYLSD